MYSYQVRTSVGSVGSRIFFRNKILGNENQSTTENIKKKTVGNYFLFINLEILLPRYTNAGEWNKDFINFSRFPGIPAAYSRVQ